MSNLKNLEKKALELNNDLELVKKELKRIQSIKCRFIKQKARKDYEIEMTKILNEEQLLKEVRNYLEPKKIAVTSFTKDDIELLNYDETIKAIKSIQSKKCNSQWLSDQTEYNKACEIESMLLEHKKLVKPVDETVVKKSQINDLINNLEQLNTKIDRDYIIEQLKNLINE